MENKEVEKLMKQLSRKGKAFSPVRFFWQAQLPFISA
jgi:hypothetical protein